MINNIEELREYLLKHSDFSTWRYKGYVAEYNGSTNTHIFLGKGINEYYSFNNKKDFINFIKNYKSNKFKKSEENNYDNGFF